MANTPWIVGQKMSFRQMHLRSNPQPAAATARYAGCYEMFSNENTTKGMGKNVQLTIHCGTVASCGMASEILAAIFEYAKG